MHKQTKKFTLATISALSLLGTGVITANQVSASENTSTEKQIEATITKVEIDYLLRRLEDEDVELVEKYK